MKQTTTTKKPIAVRHLLSFAPYGKKKKVKITLLQYQRKQNGRKPESSLN